MIGPLGRKRGTFFYLKKLVNADLCIWTCQDSHLAMLAYSQGSLTRDCIRIIQVRGHATNSDQRDTACSNSLETDNVQGGDSSSKRKR